MQCPVPITEVGGETKRLYGLFTLDVVQTFSNGDPSVTKKTVEVLIFDSTCQTCDDDTNICALRVRLFILTQQYSMHLMKCQVAKNNNLHLFAERKVFC